MASLDAIMQGKSRPKIERNQRKNGHRAGYEMKIDNIELRS